VRALAWLCCAVLCVGVSVTAPAFVLHVPIEYPTIQAGIDAAFDGDTVLVGEGVYTGDGNRDLDFWAKAIVVASENGPHTTIIDCEASGWDPHRGFYFTRGEGPGSVVQGFTIKNGQWPGLGGGIRCAVASSPTIIGNIFVGNVAQDGGGIGCSASSPLILNNTFAGNMAYSGGGICAVYHSDPVVINSILRGDSAAAGNEFYWDTASSITVTYSNVAGGWPGQGNIDGDPKYVLEERQDYRLRRNSPCIDAGDPYFLDPDSTWSDIGAHFLDQSKPLITYLTPQALTLQQSGTLRVLYTLINFHDEPQPCNGVAELRLPNGEPWAGNPLEGPGYRVIPAQYTWRFVREYQVPPSCPLGTFTFTWKVGLPGELFDRDRFLFAVEP